jgi:hypothetical protein
MNRIEAIRQRRAVLLAQAQQLRAQLQDGRRALGSQVGSSLLLAAVGRLLVGNSRFGRWAGLAVAALPIATAVLARFRRKADAAPPRPDRSGR